MSICVNSAETVLELHVPSEEQLNQAERICRAVLKQIDCGRNPMAILATKLDDLDDQEMSTSVVRGTLAVSDAFRYAPEMVNTPERALGLLSDLGVDYEISYVILKTLARHRNHGRGSSAMLALVLLPTAYFLIEFICTFV